MDLLAVQPRILSVRDAREDDAAVAGVEQRQRHRLVTVKVPVGVVAHERPVGDRSVEPRFRRLHAFLEPLRHLLYAIVQHAERLLECRRVRHEVRLTITEDAALLRPQALETQSEYDPEAEGEEPQGTGRECDHADGIAEGVHGASGSQGATKAASYVARLFSAVRSPGTGAT